MSTAILKGFDSPRLDGIQGLGLSKMVAPIQGYSPMLEGEFTTYTEKWNTSVTQVMVNHGNITGSRLMAFNPSQQASYVREVSDGSAVDDDTVTNAFATVGQFMTSSVMGKYMARIISDANVEIWKNGVLLQTIDVVDAATDVQSIAFSSDGKYLMIADGADDLLYLYEGS